MQGECGLPAAQQGVASHTGRFGPCCLSCSASHGMQLMRERLKTGITAGARRDIACATGDHGICPIPKRHQCTGACLASGGASGSGGLSARGGALAGAGAGLRRRAGRGDGRGGGGCHLLARELLVEGGVHLHVSGCMLQGREAQLLRCSGWDADAQCPVWLKSQHSAGSGGGGTTPAAGRPRWGAAVMRMCLQLLVPARPGDSASTAEVLLRAAVLSFVTGCVTSQPPCMFTLMPNCKFTCVAAGTKLCCHQLCNGNMD